MPRVGTDCACRGLARFLHEAGLARFLHEAGLAQIVHGGLFSRTERKNLDSFGGLVDTT